MSSWVHWLETKMRDGEVCADYMRKISGSMCKKDFFDLCVDVNGMNFLGLMSAKEGGLPYDDIKSDFKGYINGQYEGRFSVDVGESYTGAMYIGIVGKEIDLRTTCTLILDCSFSVVRVPEFYVGVIYVDSKSNVKVECPANSKLYVEVFGDGMALSNTTKNVEIIKR